MVAIVTGNGLGLFNTAASTGFGGAGAGRSTVPAYVNAMSGNLVLRVQDEQLAGTGADLAHIRTYNAQGQLTDADGDAWRWNGEQYLVLAGVLNATGSYVTRTGGDGHETRYRWNGSEYVSTDGEGAHDTLTWNAASNQWQLTEGTTRFVERYDGLHGRLISQEDESGNRIRYHYDEAGRLTQVVDERSGQAFELRYNIGGQLESVSTRTGENAPAMRQVYYAYDNLGRLQSVTTDLTPNDNSIADGKVYRTSYQYDGDSFRVTRVLENGNSSLEISYTQIDGAWRVASVADAAGVQHFSYDVAGKRTDVTNALGQVWSYFYDESGQLVETRSPANDGQRLSTRYSYDADGNVIEITDARNNTVVYEYDANGNCTMERDAIGNVVIRLYSSANQLLMEKQYTQRENTDDGVLLSAPATSRFVYDGQNRLRYVISAEGRVSEMRYHTFGLQQYAIQYAGSTFDTSSLGADEAPSEAVLDAWVQTQDRAATQLTAFEYDYRGNLSKNIGFASVNADGTGLLDEAATVTEYVYDSHGLLLQTLAVRGVDRHARAQLTSYSYDGMGRLLAHTGASGTTITHYDDINNRISSTSASGLTRTMMHDAQGRLLSVAETAADDALREVRYVYDEAGQLRMVQDASGGRSYIFYDDLGRVRNRVDSAGAVVSYRYNEANQVTQEIRHGNVTTTTNWFDGVRVTKKNLTIGGYDADVLINTFIDRSVSYLYDTTGQLLKSVDEQGVATSYEYDAASRLIAKTVGDRVTRYLYDLDGLQVGVVDALGYLTETKYDSAGRVIETIRYSAPTDHVAISNDPPVWAATQQFSIARNTPVSITLPPAHDPEGKPLRYQLVTPLPVNLEFDAATRIISGLTNEDIALKTITVRAIDDRGAFADQTFELEIVNGNLAPLWQLNDYSTLATEPLHLQLPSAIDTDSLTYKIVGSLPQGLSFNNGTRVISGVPMQPGAYAITVRATDSKGAYVDAQFTLSVMASQAPRWLPLSNQSIAATAQYQYTLPEAIDPNGYAVSYGVVGPLPAGIVFNEQSRMFSGAALASGHFQITVRATNTNGVSADANFILTVLQNQSPVYHGGLRSQSFNVEPGQGTVYVSLSLPANTFSDPEGAQLTYSAAGLPYMLTIDPNTGLISGYTGSTRVYTVVVRATDPAGGYAEGSFQLHIIGNTGTHPIDTQPLRVQSENSRGTQTAIYLRNNVGDDPLASWRPRDTSGLRVHAFYDAQGRLIGSVDEQGFVTQHIFDAAQNRQYSIRYTTPVTVDDGVTFDVLLAGVRSGEKQISTIEYDDMGRAVRSTNHEGSVTQLQYDGAGRLVRQVTAAGTTEARGSRIRYNAFGQVTGELAGKGDAAIQNSNGQLSLDNALAQFGIRHQYDSAGRRTQTTDAEGNHVWYYYDSLGRVTHLVNALGEVQETRYDSFGQVTDTIRYYNRLNVDMVTGGQVTDTFLGLVANLANEFRDQHEQFSYDNRGAVIEREDAEGNRTYFEYTQYGELQSEKRTVSVLHGPHRPPSTVATEYYYNKRGERIGATQDVGGLNLASFAQFDAFGRVVNQTSAMAQQVRTVYLDGGRIIQTIDSDNRTVKTEYDAFGRVLKTYDAAGNATTYNYDSINRSVEVVTPEGIAVTTRRNRHGETLSVLDGRGNTIHYQYDKNGHLTKTIDALGHVSEQVYADSGRLIETVDARGTRVRMEYDAVNRIVRRTVDPNGLAISTRYQFDGLGRQIRVVAGEGSPEAITTGYSYDRNGQVLSVVVDPDGLALTTRYRYDGLGRQVTVSRGSASNPDQHVTEYQFDNAGRRIAEIVDPSNFELKTTYHYDNAGRVTRKTDPAGNSTWYVYNSIDQMTQVIDAEGGVTRFEYDENGRMVATRRLLQRVDTSLLGDIVEHLDTVETNADQRAYSVYDKNGRQQFSITAVSNSAWTITESRYDANGNVIATIAYDQFVGEDVIAAYSMDGYLSVSEVRTILGQLGYSAQSLGESRLTRFAYNAINQLRFSVDAEGAVTEQRYDAVGNVVHSIRYGDDLTAEDLHGVLEDSHYSASAPNDRVVPWANTEQQVIAWNLSDTTDFEARISVQTDKGARQLIYRVENGTPYTEAGDYVIPLGERSKAADVLSVVRNLASDLALFEEKAFITSVDGFATLQSERVSNLRLLASADAIDSRLETLRAQGRATLSKAQSSYAYYDAVGRQTFIVNALGSVTQFAYNTVGQLISSTRYERTINADAHTSADEILLALNAEKFWGFDSATQEGLDLSAVGVASKDSITWADGRLAFSTLSYREATTHSITSKQGIDTTRRVTLRMEVTTDQPSAYRRFTAGLEAENNTGLSGSFPTAGKKGDDLIVEEGSNANEKGKKTSNWHGVEFEGNKIYASYVDQNTKQLTRVLLGTAKDHTEYVVELEVLTRGTGLFVYEKGKSRTDGFTHVNLNATWGMARFRASSNIIPGADGTTVYLDNVSINQAGVQSNRRTEHYIYDSAGRQRFAVDALGVLSETVYNDLGLTAEVRQHGISVGSTLTLDAFTALVGARHVGDGITRGERYEYDQVGRLIATVDAHNQREFYQYDAVGNRTHFTNKKGATWTYAYDRLGQLTAETTPEVPLGRIDSAGNVASFTGKLVTRMSYDAFGNVLTRTEGIRLVGGAEDASAARTTEYGYDRVGRQIVTQHSGWYDEATKRYVSSGSVTAFKVTSEVVYDALGNAVHNRVRTGMNAYNNHYKAYDALGRLTYDMDTQGYVTSFRYDAFGNQVAITRHANVVTAAPANARYYTEVELAQTGEGAALARSERDRSITTEYDKLNRQSVVRQPLASNNFQTPSNWNTHAATTVSGYQAAPTTQFIYNSFGELVEEWTKIQDATGSVNGTDIWAKSFHYYDAVGQRVATVDAERYFTRFSYDKAGNLIGQTEYANRLSTTNISSVSLPTAPTSVAEKDRVVQYEYDLLNRQTVVRQQNVQYWLPLGTSQYIHSGLATVTVSATEYDAVGNVTEQRDAAGNVTVMQYDALGRVTKQIDPTRKVTSAYIETALPQGLIQRDDPFKNQISVTPITTFVLDEYGNVLKQTRDAGGGVGGALTSRTVYDIVGNAVQSWDAAGQLTNLEYDSQGRVIRESRQVTATYTAWTGNTGNTQLIERFFHYDAAGRQIATLDSYQSAEGRQQSGQLVSYSAFGEVQQEVRVWGRAEQTLSELNHAVTASYIYDDAGRVMSKRAADGSTVFYYNLTGQNTRTEQRGDGSIAPRISENRYDLLGRAVAQRLPSFTASNGSLATPTTSLQTPQNLQQFDRWGNVVERTDARGYVTRYDYDHANRVIRETLPQVSASVLNADGSVNLALQSIKPIHELHYDLMGNVVQERDGSINAANGQTSWHRTRSRGYDNMGQLKWYRDATSEWNSDATESYVYDSHGRRIATRNTRGTVIVESHDANGNVIRKGILRQDSGNTAYNSFMSSATPQEVVLNTYRYDSIGRLTSEVDGALEIAQNSYRAGNTRHYVYDERGNVVHSRTAADLLRQFSFDHAGRKQEERDGLGNTLTWLYSNANDYSFGQLLSHKDLGGHITSYAYNGFGQARSESYSWFNGSREYHYHENGLLKEIKDQVESGTPGGSNQGDDDYLEQVDVSTYFYDIGGNRVREVYTSKRTWDQEEYEYIDNGDGYGYFQFSHISTQTLGSSRETRTQYDALGRISQVYAPRMLAGTGQTDANSAELSSLTYSYDEVGNRRRILSTYKKPGYNENTLHTTDYWYTYDREGRITTSQGMLDGNNRIVVGAKNVDGKLKAQGVRIEYDTLGRRATAESWNAFEPKKDNPFVHQHVYRKELYEYNDLGLLTSIKARYGGSQSAILDGSTSIGEERDALIHTYSDRGFQLTSQEMDDKTGNRKSRTERKFNGDGQVMVQRVYNEQDKLIQRIDYDDVGNFDAAGNLLKYTVEIYDNGVEKYRQNYATRYALYEGYQESETIVTSTQAHTQEGTTSNTYNHKGQLTNVSVTGDQRYTQTYTYNREGQILTKSELKPGSARKYQDYFYVGGNPIANIGTITEAEFDYNYTPISSQYPGATPSSYVVNSGDTLASIAQQVFGDARLWYLIADANSIQTDTELVVGRSLKIPNVVSNLHNDSNTFKPYNPSQIFGNNTPSPALPPPPNQKCHVAATIVMVAISVAVTVFTSGAAASLMGAVSGASGGIGGIFSAGLAAMAGGTAAGVTVGSAGVAIASAGMGGFVGNLASQYAGKAMNVLDDIDFGAAVMNGVTSAATASVGALASAQVKASAAKALKDTPYGTPGVNWLKGTGLSQEIQAVKAAAPKGNIFTSSAHWLKGAGAINKAADSAISYLIGQGISSVFTGHSSFSWAGLAGSSIGAPIAGKVSKGIEKNVKGVIGEIAADTAGSFVKDSVKQLIGKNGKVDWVNIAADSFGNAIGNAIVDSVISASRRAQARDSLRENLTNMGIFGKEAADGKYIDQRWVNRTISSNERFASQILRGELDWTEYENAKARELIDLFSANGEDTKTIFNALNEIGLPTLGLEGEDVTWEIKLEVVRKISGRRDDDLSLIGQGLNLLSKPLSLVGRAAIKIGDEIESNFWAKYGLMTLDLMGGPLKFALTKAVEYSPLGTWLTNLQGTFMGEATEYINDEGKFEDMQLAGEMTAGGFVVFGLAVGGSSFVKKVTRKVGDFLSGIQNKVTKKLGADKLFGLKEVYLEVKPVTVFDDFLPDSNKAILELTGKSAPKQLLQLTAGPVQKQPLLLNGSKLPLTGQPATNSLNRLSTVLEHDVYGNEIYYRKMYVSEFNLLEQTGILHSLESTETSLSPLMRYVKKYNGVLVRFTMKPGTTSALQEIGIAANTETVGLLPNLQYTKGKWGFSRIAFKLEARNRPEINKGQGVINTQLGRPGGKGVDLFNKYLIIYEKLP